MAKDYYSLLGVDKNATEADIKKAFRKLAHEHHPDKSSGDAEKFKEINEAYQVLNNKEKRDQYDQYGTTFDQARRQGNAGPGGFGGFSAEDFSRAGGPFGGGFRTENINFDFGDLGDIFGDLFGGGVRSRTRTTRSRAGADIEAAVQVTFEEAAFGTEKVIELERQVACDRCGGDGVEPGAKKETCPTCSGAGQVEQLQQTFMGTFRQASVCPECQGEGQRASKKCSSCGGDGRKRGTETMKLKIPAGINDGESLRLSGKGQAGQKGTSAGDLFIRISIAPHSLFSRDGDDVRTTLGISVSDAALGAKKNIQTLDGEVVLKIPSGAQSGKEFRLSGKGIPHLRKRGRGDHFVTGKVVIPSKLSSRERKLYEELGELK